MKLYNPFRFLSRLEWILWGCSMAVVLVSFLIGGQEGILSLIASLIGVTALILVSKGGKFRADLKDSQGLVLKRMLYDTVRIQVFDGATGHSKVFALHEWFSLSNEEDRELLTLLYGFSPKGELGLPSMSDVLTLLDSEEISDYEIRLVKEEKRHYILVSFTYTLTGVKEEYELDLETGIVLGARSSLDGVTYYTVETEEIRYNVSEYEDSYFKIQ